MANESDQPVNEPKRRCIIGITGQHIDPKFPVDIWFDSLKSVANVLCLENQKLLNVIREQEPKSITELASLTGRAVSNVSRTLKNMNAIGLVEIKNFTHSKKKYVHVKHYNFLILI